VNACLLAALVLGLAGTSHAQPIPLRDAFEKQVLAYELADKTEAPPKGAILLAGDSQFFRWKTFREDLPGYSVVNRGIDSFQTSDLIHYADRLVLPHRPRMIILHVGGNDVHNGKTPERVLADFKTFVARVHATLPGVPIAFSSITPGPGRWDEAPVRQATNGLLKKYIASQPGLHFIDLWDAMLTADGKPREDLWVEDRIHPNRAGYLLRAEITRPILGAPDRTSLLPNVTFTPQEEIKLWPGSAPGETGKIGPERIVPARPRPFDQITDVTVPTLSVFQPAAEKRTGTGILLIPGGGLDRLAIEHEGYEAAEWLTRNGITAFLLKYRVPARDPEKRWKAGVQDAQRAMGLIRAHAEKWKVDADAIGSLGFSAGAEINVLLSVLHREPRQYEAIDAADRLSTRPDFNIAVYAGGFADTRGNTLRDDILKRLDQSTPPMFIVHAFDDDALTSIILMGALKRANIASELHIFGAGGHGFGVRETGLPVGQWRDLGLKWLAWQGFLDDPAVRQYARAFLSARDEGRPALPRFGGAMKDAGEGAARTAQRRIVARAIAQGDQIVGYKGAGTGHGVLLKSGRIDASTATPIVLDPRRPLRIEAGIGYVMAVDIGTKLRVPRQALTSVDALVPVVGLPLDVASLTGGTFAAKDGIAANFGLERFIVGAPVTPAATGDLAGLSVSIERNGLALPKGTRADIKSGDAARLMALINGIIDQGHVIHRGDIIVAGAIDASRPGEAGRYTAAFGPLGTIAFELR
jgi:acetyl esterase/lipase/2-keto-4-pentenoate hydratase/lysophospholipase L1-like esterase